MAKLIRSFFKRHWRGILNTITFAALFGLIFAIRNDILETLRNIQHVNYWALLLIIPLQIWNYDAYARLYRTMLNKLEHPVSYRNLYRVALELNFVNHVFPSGGISGFSFFSLRMKEFGVRSSTATIVQALRFFFGYLGFFIVLAFGIIALAVNGRANNFVMMLATFLSTLIVIGGVLLVYVVGDSKRINYASALLAKIANKILSLIMPSKKEVISLDKLRSGMDEMHKSYLIIQNNRDILKRGILYGFLTTITEIMTIYVVYIAFNEFVNIGAVILAYAVANFAGLVSVLPGGVGIYEALMTATLAATGISPALSIPVTVMYRVLGISVQIIPGWILYHATLNRAGEHAG